LAINFGTKASKPYREITAINLDNDY